MHDPTGQHKDQLEKLVLEPLVRRAREQHATAVTRLANIAQQLAVARQADAIAKAAYQEALMGAGDLSMIEAGRQATAAAHDLSIMEDANRQAERNVAKAKEDERTAQRAAWAPVVMEGLRRRLAATRAADEARKALARAADAYAQADGIMRWATNTRGALTPPGQGWEARPLGDRTEADERRYWEGNHVNFETGTFPGMPAEAAQ